MDALRHVAAAGSRRCAIDADRPRELSVGRKSAIIQALGGVSPYKWKLTTGKLPKGFKLSKAGVLSGTAKAKKDPSGPYPITVEVTDATKKIHQTATADLTLNVG